MLEALKSRWVEAGLKSGSLLLLHSDIKRTLIEFRRKKIPVTPGDILDSFLEVLGPDGTLLLPCFNFDFCHGSPFDIRNTPSQMGAMTEAARARPGVVRTGHPVYSFLVLGRMASEFSEVDNSSAYAADSPFGILRRLGGTIGSLDLDDQNSMTFYHHVEEMKSVDYRQSKTFTGDYTDRHGTTARRSYKIYVRKLEKGIKTDGNPAGELMWKAGLYKGFRPGDGPGLRLIDADEMFRFLGTIIDEGRALGNLYSIEEGA